MAQALCDAAMDLSFDNHRIDDGTEIIDGRVIYDFNDTCLRVNFDLGNMRSRREREVQWIVEGRFIKTGF